MCIEEWFLNTHRVLIPRTTMHASASIDDISENTIHYSTELHGAAVAGWSR
jgi:hypothetical protein